jgi:hypothetical protein
MVKRTIPHDVHDQQGIDVFVTFDNGVSSGRILPLQIQSSTRGSERLDYAKQGICLVVIAPSRGARAACKIVQKTINRFLQQYPNALI